jgi:hypothetical protein
MELHYLLDTEGNQTAVVIPIEDWKSITSKYEDLKLLEKPKKQTKKKKPSDFLGCLSKGTAQKMIFDITESRNQWERTI